MKRRTKTSFGKYLVDEIRQAGMSQEEFYTTVKIAKPYFYDLLTGSPPPIEIQKRMLDVLEDKTGVDSERRIKFYDLAAQGRCEIPADISSMILGHPQRMTDIRTALTSLLTTQG